MKDREEGREEGREGGRERGGKGGREEGREGEGRKERKGDYETLLIPRKPKNNTKKRKYHRSLNGSVMSKTYSQHMLVMNIDITKILMIFLGVK